jgi:microcystin-dependent protein
VVNPRTVNTGIIVPLTGADVDLWGEDDVNPNMVAIDGLFGGVQSIPVSSGIVTLTSPSGFTATPGPGPTQAQNAVIRFTGALVGNVLVILPLPGRYVMENLTTGAAQIQVQGATAQVEAVSLPPGEPVTVYNDGSVVRFVGMGRPGALEFWAGLNAIPGWVIFNTIKPYLLCDGTVYNVSDYPYLFNRLGGSFGGNGVSTFAVPDLRGRYPLAYDGTGSRVTVGGCGINGQAIGAALDAQSITLTAAQMPSHFHGAGIYDPTHAHSVANLAGSTGNTGGGGAFGNTPVAGATAAAATGVRVNSSNGLDTTYSSGGSGSHNNMPNTLVTGIWVVKT